MANQSGIRLHFDADIDYWNDVAIDHPAGDQATVVVLGLARGGTSSIAAALDALGVYMGPVADLSAGGCFENFAFVHCDPEHPENIGPYIKKLNTRYDRWGFKLTYKSVFRYLPLLRNPRLIVVTRDPLAIATSGPFKDRFSKEGLEFVGTLMSQTIEVIDLATKTNLPAMFISYERAMRHHMRAIERLVAFTGVVPTFDQICEAHARLRPFGGYMRQNDGTSDVTATAAWSDR